MNLNTIWSALEESSDILGGYAYPAMDRAATEMGLPPDYFFWVAITWFFNEEPLDVAAYMRAFPYGLVQVNEDRLALFLSSEKVPI